MGSAFTPGGGNITLLVLGCTAYLRKTIGLPHLLQVVAMIGLSRDNFSC